LLAVVLPATSFCSASEATAFRQTKPPVPKEWSDTSTRPENWAVRLQRLGLSNFYRVTTNLYRGAQPTARGMAELKAMGIKTVVNLRSFHSDDEELTGAGLKQGRLHLKPWHAEDQDIIDFLKLATNTNNLPVFVHCQRGADRTGMACAMYRIVVCGWTKPEAIREMKEGGFGFNPAWNGIVAYIERADVAKIKQRAGIGSREGSVR
jgi:protein tyrosine/serine phosphatase